MNQWIDRIEDSIPNREVIKTIVGGGNDATALEIVKSYLRLK